MVFFVFPAFTILIEYPYGPRFPEGELTMGRLRRPAALSMLATGALLGRAVSRHGPEPVTILGVARIIAGAGLLVLFHRALGEMARRPGPLFIGRVAVLIAMTNAIVLSAERHALGVQNVMNPTFRNLGSAVGPVLLATIPASFPATYVTFVSPPGGAPPGAGLGAR
ncbi:MAG: hypothetical protein ACRECR_06205 [Thermoplasmata archaeon]